MTDSSSVDPFSTFLNTQSGHVSIGGPPAAESAVSELPDEAWTVLRVLGRERAAEVASLKAATTLPTMLVVRLLAMLEERGLARVLQDDEDDIAMITKAGRTALAARTENPD
ncbi:hypothetical protein FNH05_08975 [Amycolatopsis rhizosphaerae]|uniref:MarR family transcriptional regulator n=1 Tax=Amycolatopsis rhizosphaerae TaxID=2053003 RepID=A0A558D497_9PSEU|nr:hypothetical protein [Amycolatopsis rhizosphaerae]TVT55840.1 hypothetical protein FNH05_08975 [Amycolatopsis rhizosphaerae]